VRANHQDAADDARGNQAPPAHRHVLVDGTEAVKDAGTEKSERSLYECCRQLRDLGDPVRSRDELLGILERLNTEDTTEEAARLGASTTNLFGEIYRELADDEPPAAAVEN